MKKNLITLLFALFSTFSFAQFQVDWGYNFNSTTTSLGVNLYGYFIDVAIDDQGNIYALGNVRDSMDVDPGPGTHILVSGGNDYHSMMLVKYRSDGSFVWGHAFASPMTYSIASGIEIDSQHNLHVVMATYGQIDMDPDSGTTMVGDLSGTRWTTALAKYDTTGALISAVETSHPYAGFTSFYGHPELFVSASDTVYLMNRYEGSIDLDPGAGTFTASTNAKGMYISILDVNHNFQNAFAIEVPNWLETQSIVADSQGNIFASFYAYDNFDLDPGPGVTTVNAPVYNYGFDPGDNIAVKYSRAGTPMGFVQTKEGYGQIALKKNGGILLYGVFNSVTDFDPSSGVLNIGPSRNGTGYIASYNAAFQNEWVGQFEQIAPGYSNLLSAYESENGEIKACLNFFDRVDLDPGTAVAEETGHPQGGGIALISIDSTGNRMGHSLFNRAGQYKNSSVIHPGPGTSLMFMGQFQDTLDLDPGPGELLVSSGTYPDGFFAKMDPDLTIAIESPIEGGDNWNVWPVPASHAVWIQSVAPTANETRVSVIDMRGVQVAVQNFTDTSMPLQVSLRDLPDGIYILEIVQEQTMVRRKIWVQGK